MGVIADLRKAIAGRRKRTNVLAGRERKQRRALAWRRKRTAELLKAYRRNPTPAGLKRYRDSRALAGSSAKRTAAMHKLTQKSRAKLAGWRRRLRAKQTTPGERAVRAAGRMVGKTETGYNDSGWLRQMENDLPHNRLDWMIPGQPYCGFGCIWAWWVGAHKLLPDGTVYTPNICGGGAYGSRVSAAHARPGDLVVMNFGSGGAKHVALARGPAKGGTIPTVEFNTSPSNAGSQGNGGGVWYRTRPLGLVLCVVRPK